MSIELVNRHAYVVRRYPRGMEKKGKAGGRPAGSAFGRRVRERREELKLSQKAIAEAAKIKQPSLSAIESGQTSLADIKVPTLFGLAKALKMTIEQLAGLASAAPLAFVHDNVEAYAASQETIERVQLLADYGALPADMQIMVAKNAADLRRYFESLEPAIRKHFGAPADPERRREWERDIEADVAGIKHREGAAVFMEQARANMATAPAPVRKVAETAQKELDKHQAKSGPRWVFVVVHEE